MKITNIKNVKNQNIALIRTDSVSRFMYLEEGEEGLLEQEVGAFLELGEKYEVEKLKELAEITMVRSLKKENMIEFFQAADMFR